MSSSKSKDEIWDEWRDLVNMAPAELADWLRQRANEAGLSPVADVTEPGAGLEAAALSAAVPAATPSVIPQTMRFKRGRL